MSNSKRPYLIFNKVTHEYGIYYDDRSHEWLVKDFETETQAEIWKASSGYNSPEWIIVTDDIAEEIQNGKVNP